MRIILSLLLLLVLAGPPEARSAAPEPAISREPTGHAEEVPENLERILAGRPLVDQALTRDQAVAIALRESPVVRGAVAEVESAAGRWEAARAETRPWISANTFLTGGSNANILATPPFSRPQMIMGLPRGAFLDQNVMLMYPLSTGGRLKAMIRQAAAQREASREELEARRQDVVLMTRTTYHEVLARRALADVARARLQENQERLRIDRARLQQEQVPAFYVLRDEAEVAAAQQELTNAERDVELALLQMKTVMGVHPGSRVDVVGSLEYQSSADLVARLTTAFSTGETLPPASTRASALPSDLRALLRLAERQRPELKAIGLRVREREAEIAVARSAFRPQVNAAAMGDLMKMKGEDPFVGGTFGVVASLPLFNGGQRAARVRTAEAERQRQEQEREQVALQVAQEVSAALLNMRAAEKNVQAAQAALTAAQEEYRVANLRYQAGRSIVLEALDALAARVRAESNVVQALFEHNLAQDQLRRAVGTLDATVRPRTRSGISPVGEKSSRSRGNSGGIRRPRNAPLHRRERMTVSGCRYDDSNS